MNRREILSGMLAFPMLGLATARGTARVPSRSCRFQDSLEEGLFEALKGVDFKGYPPWKLLRSYRGREAMARALSPVIDLHMQEWRKEKGIELYLGPYQEVHERTCIAMEEVYGLDPSKSDAPLLMTARKVWGKAKVIQAREAVMHMVTEASRHYVCRPDVVLQRRHEPVPLRTSVFSEDRPDLRVIGFGVMTTARDEYLNGYLGPARAFRFCHFDDLYYGAA
jgi:hypothetical protein